MTPVLDTHRLSRSFGALQAVRDVSIRVEPGEFRAVIGPNGAGKTTLFNLISGKLAPSSGEVFFRNEDVTSMSDVARCQRGISRTFQITSIFPDLTVEENVRIAVQLKSQGNFRFFGGHAHLKASAQRAREMLDLLGIIEHADALASTLAHGNQRLLEIAMAVAQDPLLLLLDEPTQGLSAEETTEAVEVIRRIARDRKLTVLLVEHDMEVVFGLADRISVLHFGEIIANGTPREIQVNPEVQKAYLGAE
jgi:branched-chain amino acid transport system ATP-binding protein